MSIRAFGTTPSAREKRSTPPGARAFGPIRSVRVGGALLSGILMTGLLAATTPPAAVALDGGTVAYEPAESNISGKYWVSATASSGDANLAIDGDVDTVWSAKGPGPATLTVDLGGSYDAVHKVRTTFGESDDVYKYRLQGSTDSRSWRTLADRSGNTEQGSTFTDVFAVKGLRHLRLVVAEGQDAGVGEFDIFNYLRDDLDNGSDSSEQGRSTVAYHYNAGDAASTPGIRGGRHGDPESAESGNNFFGLTKDLGWDTTRLRVWNEPKSETTGAPSTSTGNASPDNTRRVAKSVVGADQNLAIDFHYSDSWADPHNQPKPYAWSELPFDELVDTTYDWSYDFVKSLVDQGTTPSTVAIGNEIARGMMWGQEYDLVANDLDYHHYYQSGRHLAAPGGGIKWLKYDEANGDTSSPAYQEFLGSVENLGRLVDAGNRAVRQVNADMGTDIETQMHFAFNKWAWVTPGNREELDPDKVFAKYMTLIDLLSGHLDDRGGMVDQIGLSYYADWHGTYDVFQRELVEISRKLPNVSLKIAESSPKFQGTVPSTPGADANRPVGFPYTVQSQGEDTINLLKTINDIPNNAGTGLWVWAGTNVFGSGSGDNGSLKASFQAWNDGFAKNVVESDVSVVTKPGAQPALPATVSSLDRASGATSKVAVAWDEVDPRDYASSGTFTVHGTADVAYPDVHTDLAPISEVGRGVAMRDVTATVTVLKRAPVLRVAPRVSGKPVVGRTLRSTPGAWDVPEASVRFQWLRGGKPIRGAEQRRYQVRPVDVKSRISVRVTSHAQGRVTGEVVTAPSQRVTRAKSSVRLRMPSQTKAGARLKVRALVRTAVLTPRGWADVYVANKKVRTVRVRDGVAQVFVRPAKAGRVQVRVVYRGNAGIQPSRKARWVQVRR